MSQPTQNLILYDWFSFSLKSMQRDDMIAFLGLPASGWTEGLGSKYFYKERWLFGKGISIHFGGKNGGVFVEMSGQGCRELETYGCIDFDSLIPWVIAAGGNISRVDIAYDDFTGVLDIDEMFRAAQNFEFVATSHAINLAVSGSDRQHLGKSVCHGSRSSEVFFRCYDKRAERKAYDDYDHWIRFEMQLRGNAAYNFCSLSGSIGEKFSAVINNYLRYVVPDPDDSNTARWEVCDWWRDFVSSVDRISLYTKKDVEYNRERLRHYVYDQCAAAIKTIITIEGYQSFLDQLPSESEIREKQKYARLIDQDKKWKQEAEEARKKKFAEHYDHVTEVLRSAVSQCRRDEILKTICGGT